MKAYVAFLDTLHGLAHAGKPDALKLASALDGQAGRELRSLVPLETLRSQGAFFTDSTRAERLVKSIPENRLKSGLIVDAQCGAGNLLLAVARKLPIHDSPENTIRSWGKRLGGIDCDTEFVRAAKYRLWLLAVQRCSRPPKRVPVLDAELPLFKVANSLGECELQGRAELLLLNPPYQQLKAPAHCDWASGLVSAAAVFVDDAIRKCKVGCTIAAILPDVLRSGSRYERWRLAVESLAKVERVELGGLFDAQTDVNVFSAILRRGSSLEPAVWSDCNPGTSTLIRDLFDVRVGPVVPFRTAKRGPWRHYLTMAELCPWTRISRIEKRRRFAGTTYNGPFVAVRRVSRPEDEFRALPTLIDVEEPVAVENHILICRPKSGSLEHCQQLLQALKNPAATEWLNRSICCRHLTTRAILEMPLSS